MALVTRRKRARTGDEDDVREYVPTAVLQAAFVFFRDEPLIPQCRAVLAQHVFPTGWGIAWATNPRAPGPVIFNTPYFLRALQHFFLDALDHLRLYRAVSFWYRRDIAGWLRDYIQAATPADLAAAGLPFGVLAPEQTRLELRAAARTESAFLEHVLAVRVQDDDDSSRRYVYGVFNDGMQLQPLSPERLKDAQTLVASKTGVAARTASITSEAWTAQCRKPVSPIYELMERAADIQEARRNVLDADWQVSHPRMLLRSRPPDISRVDPGTLGDASVYSAEDIYLSGASKVRQQQNMSVYETIEYINRLRRQLSAAAGHGRSGGRGDGSDSMRQRQKEHYDRPEAWDDALPLPEYVEVANAPVPTIINDVRVLEQDYRLQVLALMGLPESVLTRSSGARAGAATLTGERSNEAHALHYLEETVRAQRELVERLFAHLWLSAFGPYHMDQVDAKLTELEERLVNGEEGEELLRTTTAMRDYLRSVQTRTLVLRESEAVLTFPAEATLQETEHLALQLQLYDRGLVEVKELERAARAATGKPVKLREPPVADDAPAAKKPRRGAAAALPVANKGPSFLGVEETPRSRLLTKK